MTCARFCRKRRRFALTLIEVVAGLTLLSLTLVVGLAGIQRHAQQLSRAKRRLAAVEVADQLFTEWQSSVGFVPLAQSGERLHKDTRWLWNAEPVPTLELGITKIRLAVRARDATLPDVVVEVLATPPRPPGAAP